MSAYDDASARLSQAPATPYYNLAANSATNPGGLGGYGHRTAFFALIADILTVASYMLAQATTFLASITGLAGQANTSATNAAASAASALNSPGTLATTVTNIVPAAGVIALVLQQVNKAFQEGQTAVVASAAAASTKYIQGKIIFFNPATGAMQIDVQAGYFAGAAFADGKVSLAAGGGVAASRIINVAGLVQGGGDLSADRTITVTAATPSDVRIGTDTSKALTVGTLITSASFYTLTDAATIAWDVASGYNATVTMAGNRTIGALTNLKDGITYTLELVQDATGTRVPSWNAIWDWGAAGVPTLQTAAGKADKVFAQYNSRTGKLDASFRKGA